MSRYAVASRYAKSLLDLSIEQNKLEDIYSDIVGFKESLGSRDLIMLLKSPIIKADKKISAFKAVFGGKFNELTMAFFELIMKKGREENLPDIANAFITQYREHNNISSAKVITATKLSAEKLEEVKSKILSFSDGDKVEITEEIDESLIGGFVIEIGDKIYDASVKHKLNKLKKAFS